MHYNNYIVSFETIYWEDILMASAKFMTGFGNSFETEALAGALPQGQNSPQNCAYGLYAEQLSGSAFTVPRGMNERSWLYRIRPSVCHRSDYHQTELPSWLTAPQPPSDGLPFGQLRWDPVPLPNEPVTFLAGIHTMTTAGDCNGQTGMASHVYACNQSMEDDYMCNADGELLVVPQLGGLSIRTELGVLEVTPGHLALLPRGLIFQVHLHDDKARGYVCENYGGKFALPERGPIGANCLANSRDFKTPVAWYEDKEQPCRITMKWCGRFFQTEARQSPLDVVAWHGNYAPYQYDMATFSPVGAIWNDHPDPSIFTVITSPSGEAGTANIDFVIFPPRWAVAENTFRPPWFHRNIMSEFMGLVKGKYDAKGAGFSPGGMSLHNMMLPHGPDTEATAKAQQAELKPVKLDNTLAFMFETRYPQMVSHYAAALEGLQHDYHECWSGIKRQFEPEK